MDNRRGFLRTTALAVAGAACAPAVAPVGEAPGSGNGAKAEWEQQWDSLASAAKAEGRLNVLTLVGASFRKSIDAFQEAFPGVSVEHEAFASASIWIPKVDQERKAGIYSWDIVQTPVQSV